MKRDQLFKEKFVEYMDEHDDDDFDDLSVGSARGSVHSRLGGLGGLRPVGGLGGLGSKSSSPSKPTGGLGGLGSAKPTGGLGGLGSGPSSPGRPAASIGKLGGGLGKPASGIGGLGKVPAGGLGGLGKATGGLGGLSKVSTGSIGGLGKAAGAPKAAGAQGGIGGLGKLQPSKPQQAGAAPDSFSKALEEITKSTLNLNLEITSSIGKIHEENTDALKGIANFLEGLTDRTLGGFKEITNRLNQQDEQPDIQESLDALVKNIDDEIAAKRDKEVYIIIPGHDTSTVTTEEAADLLKGKSVRVFGSMSLLATVTGS